MPTTQQQMRLARLEAATAHRSHSGVILYRDRAEVPGLLAEAQRAGRIAEGFGVLALPEPLPISKWRREARDYFESLTT